MTPRRCIDCKAHEPVQDGNRCPECLNAMLRATRPAFEPEWLRRSRQHRTGLARDLTGIYS
jgi:hypothetical protein